MIGLPVSHERFLLRLFPLETEKYLHRHPATGVYILYENWSTETFKKSQISMLFVTPTKSEDTLSSAGPQSS